MDGSPPSFAMLRQLLQRVPLVLKTAILNLLSRSPTNGKQDLRTEVTVSLIRSFLTFSSPATKSQRRSMRDPGIKGGKWISKITMPRPAETDARDALVRAIEQHKEGEETYDMPDICDVEAEWTGYRKDVDKNATLPDISEQEKYQKMMGEVEESLTVLYFHGGAYYLMDPCTHREVTTRLAKQTKGRCLSVRYRLAPQNPFPAAVLDALLSYLYLLAPPEGSFHDPVPADKIVFAGDSAGGGLSLALLQTLLTLRRENPDQTIRFHGKDVPIQLPAGVSTMSPFCDQTRSLPSTLGNAVYDYLPPPPQRPGTVYAPVPIPPDSLWPTSPPRVDFYSHANIVAHPLVSPISGPADIWKDAPPILIAVGEESLEDDAIYISRKIHKTGGTVVLERFEGMPHCFGLVFLGSAPAKRCFQVWTDFCLDAINSRVQRTGTAVYVDHKAEHTETKRLDEMGSLTDEQVQLKVNAGRDWRVEGEKDLANKLEQRKEKARL